MTTTRERLENRLAKRQEWAQKAERRAANHFHAADPSEAATGIPLGQPILVGHHSERRHRRALERIDNQMRKGLEAEKLSQHHSARADGLARALDNAIYSDDADAIERLADRRTELEIRRDHMKAANAYYKAHKTLEGWDGPADIREDGESVLRHQAYYGKPFPPYAFSSLGARIRQAAKRTKEVERRQATAQAAEDAPNGVLIQGGVNGPYVAITFADKPDRTILNDLRGAGFHWSGGSWCGPKDRIPASVTALRE